MPMSQISERRLAANRANARKSTGPRTAQGKAKVSENARRTGIYSEDHRMPPRIEAHFRALAEARTQHIADPALRALSFDWHVLQGHLALHDSRERALFNAGLEYGRGNEGAAREWVLRQHGYIQALNRYAGWIQMRLRKVEAAILANPAGMDHLTRFFHPEPEQPENQPHVEQHSCCAELPLCPVETPETAASSLPKPGPVCPQLGPAEPAAVEPTASFEGTNPPSSTQPALIPIAEFEGTNPFTPATNQLRQLHQSEPNLEQLLPVVHRPVPMTTTPEPTPSQPPSHPPTREGNPVQGKPQPSGSTSDRGQFCSIATHGRHCLPDRPAKSQPGTHQKVESAGLSPPSRNISHRTAVDEVSAQRIEPI